MTTRHKKRDTAERLASENREPVATRHQPPRDSDQVAAYLDRLPRGRHKLDRELVEQSQRHRMFAALIQLAAVEGYDAVSILDVVSLAGTSKRTFYEHFTDKEDCLVQAFDSELENLLEQTLTKIVSISDRSERIVVGVHAYIDIIVSKPDFARLFLNESMSSGDRLANRWIDSINAFAEAIIVRRDLARVDEPKLQPLAPLHAKLLAAGFNHLLGMIIFRDGVAAVTEQADELADLMLTLLSAEPRSSQSVLLRSKSADS